MISTAPSIPFVGKPVSISNKCDCGRRSEQSGSFHQGNLRARFVRKARLGGRPEASVQLRIGSWALRALPESQGADRSAGRPAGCGHKFFRNLANFSSRKRYGEKRPARVLQSFFQIAQPASGPPRLRFEPQRRKSFAGRGAPGDRSLCKRPSEHSGHGQGRFLPDRNAKTSAFS